MIMQAQNHATTQTNTSQANASKTVLITGASSGIGKAFAELFAKDGYQVLLAARSVDKMEQLASAMRSEYGAAVAVFHADLEQADGADKLHAAIKARGFTLDTLVNNAGYGLFGEFKDNALPGELAMMQLNMHSLVGLTKLFLPDVLAGRGKILNVASTASFQPGPYMAVYYATKAFVLSFSEALAAELAGQGVSVTALCPGPTASGFQDKAAMHASALVKGRKLPTAEQVATAGYRAMLRGQRVVIPGVMNWLMAQSVRFTPRRIVTGMVQLMSRPIAA
jgi:short-subunit dehydrogenase